LAAVTLAGVLGATACSYARPGVDSVGSEPAAGPSVAPQPSAAAAPHPPDPDARTSAGPADPANPADPGNPAAPPPVTVEYEVTGAGVASVTYSTDTAGARATVPDLTLPWRISRGIRPGPATEVTLTATGVAGPYTCRIVIDGIERSRAATAPRRGAASTVTCSATLVVGPPDHVRERRPPPAGPAQDAAPPGSG
jgi:hypothetical protein